jgi:hypothetical protein
MQTSPEELDESLHPKHVVLLCVHSHARFRGISTIDAIRARYHNVPTTLVSLPCCPKFRHLGDIGRPPDVKYDDDCVFSACRTVDVWNFDHNAVSLPLCCQEIDTALSKP